MDTEQNRPWWKGGRPKMQDDQKASRKVQVRFTPDEYDRLLTIKSKTRSRTMSDFIRMICFKRPLRMKPHRSTYQDDVLSLVQEMRTDVLRIGVNINQAAKHINSTSSDQTLRDEVERLSRNMAQLDAQLRALIIAVQSDERSQPLQDTDPLS